MRGDQLSCEGWPGIEIVCCCIPKPSVPWTSRDCATWRDPRNPSWAMRASGCAFTMAPPRPGCDTEVKNPGPRSSDSSRGSDSSRSAASKRMVPTVEPLNVEPPPPTAPSEKLHGLCNCSELGHFCHWPPWVSPPRTCTCADASCSPELASTRTAPLVLPRGGR